MTGHKTRPGSALRAVVDGPGPLVLGLVVVGAFLLACLDRLSTAPTILPPTCSISSLSRLTRSRSLSLASATTRTASASGARAERVGHDQGRRAVQDDEVEQVALLLQELAHGVGVHQRRGCGGSGPDRTTHRLGATDHSSEAICLPSATGPCACWAGCRR